MEKTLIIFKPDSLENKKIGESLRRFEEEGFDICACKMVQLNEKILHEHYAHIKHISVFPSIVNYMSSRPVIIMVLQGKDAIQRVRDLLGPTDSAIAPKGTIRGDLGTDKTRNIAHASDSPENAEIEIKRFFAFDELFEV